MIVAKHASISAAVFTSFLSTRVQATDASTYFRNRRDAGRLLARRPVWHGVPDEARTLALIMEDPDAPRGTFTHWVYYNLAATLHELPEGVDKTPHPASGGEQGLNDFGNVGYNGPCPPPGPAHHYHLTLYALDEQLELPQSCSAQALRHAMHAHILGEGELIGTYARGH
jgi:Raf kinase inhibitor-like YbhB/YbcL family protein